METVFVVNKSGCFDCRSERAQPLNDYRDKRS